MVLEGQDGRRDGKQVTKHRITYTPNADGSVRHTGSRPTLRAIGTTTFDGNYTRK